MKKKEKKNYNGRDFLKLRLISGATKAATHTDKRKQADRDACREDYDDAEFMWDIEDRSDNS